MAEGGKSPGPAFIPNTAEAIAKPYELTYPLNAELVANVDEMLAYLFNAMKENEIRVEELEEEVEAIPPAAEPVANTFLTVSVSITEAQLEAADVTPVNLIVAVPGKIIVPVSVFYAYSRTAAYTSNPVPRLRYAGLAQSIATSVSFPFNTGGSGTTYNSNTMSDAVNYPGNPVNTSLQFSLNGALTGAGSGSMKIEIGYYLADDFT